MSLLLMLVLHNVVLLNIAIYADGGTIYSSCDKASEMWKELEMSVDLKSDLRDTMEWDGRWLVTFNDGKT